MEIKISGNLNFFLQPIITKFFSIAEPITAKQMSSDRMRKMLTERVYLNLGWSSIQIFLATLHICVICATGLKTNEETRKIINTVLAIVPDANADLDRFQVGDDFKV